MFHPRLRERCYVVPANKCDDVLNSRHVPASECFRLRGILPEVSFFRQRERLTRRRGCVADRRMRRQRGFNFTTHRRRTEITGPMPSEWIASYNGSVASAVVSARVSGIRSRCKISHVRFAPDQSGSGTRRHHIGNRSRSDAHNGSSFVIDNSAWLAWFQIASQSSIIQKQFPANRVLTIDAT